MIPLSDRFGDKLDGVLSKFSEKEKSDMQMIVDAKESVEQKREKAEDLEPFLILERKRRGILLNKTGYWQVNDDGTLSRPEFLPRDEFVTKK